ncbi:MAG TPA: hypothetical protein PKY77_10505 [Phycisphaerae bacterium]|nr:hypothetical protein [Phycisphaerae bacterium]HRY70009.1 hypothetical protein [Phycisphaerae bacterium]HSA27218.1 hypothetical protein [Phycisphaerae bacterium]
MNNIAAWRIGSWAAMMVVVSRGLAAGEPWHAADQPELKQTLEQAPTLQTESLGEPARGVNVWERWLVPNPDGKRWDVLQVYFKEYYGPTWLCVFDLGTGQARKQRLPDDHQFYLSGRALAFDGKYYVATPCRRTWSMDLFVYDVGAQKLVREIVPVAKARTTGLITEVASGRLLGLTSDPEHPDRSVLYGVDVVTGQMLFAKALPSPVSTDAYWPHWVDLSYEYHAFARGPDGFVWTYLKDVLVRTDPKDASVHMVGKLNPVGWPTFVGRDLYLAGSEQLRRIRNIAPAH